MFETVTVPKKGSSLRSAWGASVATAVNALAPMAAPGGLCRSGVTGVGIMTTPTNRRTLSEGSAPRPFDIEWRAEETNPDTGEVTEEGGWYLVRCYWQRAGVTEYQSDLKIYLPETTDSGEPTKFDDGTFLCFKCRLYGEDPDRDDGTEEQKFEFVKYESMDELNAAQRNDQYYIVPLYKTTESTDPNDWIDLRTMPVLQVFDMVSE